MPPFELNPLNDPPEANTAAPNPPLLHPADNLYLYALYADVPKIPLRPGHPHIPTGLPRRGRPGYAGYQLSFQPSSLVRLKAIDCLSPIEMQDYCWDFNDKHLPRTPIMQPNNPNVDDRPTSFLLDAYSFEGKAVLTPAGNAREMADWTMRVVTTAATVLSLVFPPAKALKFSFIADDEDPQKPVIDDNIYVPMYYKKPESAITRVTESLVSLVVVQMTPWALPPGWHTLQFLNVKQFRGFDVNSDGEVSNPDSLTRIEKVWARVMFPDRYPVSYMQTETLLSLQLWADCASVKCPFFILTNSDDWILGCFYSGWTRAICFRVLKDRCPHPSMLQWLVFWCASALGAPNSWSPSELTIPSNPDVRAPLRFQPGVSQFADMDDREWLDRFVKSHDPSAYPTENEEPNVWHTYF